MENYYYNGSTIIKYLRKVLNEINRTYVDAGLRVGFIMKRYGEKYHFNPKINAQLVLLCILKDIGSFYQDEIIAKDDYAARAASSYTFLKHCSPLGDAAKPLLFYNSKYIEEIESDEYYCGQLITLIDKVVQYNFEEYTLDEMEGLLKSDGSGKYNPVQIKNVIKLLREDEDILEKLNQKNSIFVHEVSSFVQNAEYSDEELLHYIDMTNFAFEFHNHETLAHTVTTAEIAKHLAKLSRLTENQINCIYLAALVHDIGKIRIPVSILCHPGRLEGEMLKEMKNHVVYTKEILEGSFSYLIVEIAANHHEKLDGSGYPKGLREIDLSISDKIIAVADIASALYCKRSYKARFSSDKIIDILLSDAKAGKIDLRIVNHLINNYDEIMGAAKEKEDVVLKAYENMKQEYEALSKSKQLKEFFEQNDEEEYVEDTYEVEEEYQEINENIEEEPISNQAEENIDTDHTPDEGIQLELDLDI